MKFRKSWKLLIKVRRKTMTKHQFKICEAVALGLTHYYMGPRDKREVTASERTEALATIPDLPEGWMKQKHEWDACVA